MPSPALTLWIDIATGKLLSGWRSISYAPNPSLKQGDSIGIELHIIKNYLGGSFTEYEFSPSTAVTLAVGRIDEAPSGGTFKLTYGANTTAAIAAGAEASAVQTALNAIASITAEGGVTVTKIGNSYRVIWNTPAVTSNTLSYTFNELYPTSTISTGLVRVGSPTQKQVYQVHIKQAPVANITSFVNQDAPVVAVSQIHAPAFTGDTKVWRVSIDPQPKSGSFLIGFDVGTENYTTSAIDINASGDSVLSMLNATYAGDWSVVKTGVNQWDIATTDQTIFNLSVSDSGIVAFSSKYGILDLDTAEVEDLLAGDSSADATMEIQLETDGVKFTILSQPITILNDLIDDAVYSIVQWGDYIPADKVVRFDTAQTLTNAEKQQARDNIGAVNTDTSSLVAKDVELEGRIGDLEGLGLTQNQYDAIDQSELPTGANPFVTESALSTELAGKSNVGHTHIIGDVDGLQTAIDGKASTSHSHTISDITGLNDELAGYATVDDLTDGLATKADLVHTHTTLDDCYIGILSAPVIDSVDSITFTGGFELTPSTFTSYLGEAPIDGTGYVRQDGLWSNQPSFQSASINGGNLVIGALSTIKNELNAPITFELYNDTGAGTTFLHTFNPYNGQFEFSSGGGGIKFSDTTVQTTAALPLTGGTLSGKVNLPNRTSGGVAYLNLGTVSDGLTVPSTLVEGDIFLHETAGSVGNYNVRLAYTAKNFSGVLTNYSVAVLQNSNLFTQAQVISANSNTAFSLQVTQATTGGGGGLRVTNLGSGHSFVVEDEESVGNDPSPFTISNNGKVGVGIAPDTTAAITVDSNGIKFGTGAVVQAISAIVTATGTYDKEIPVTINGVNYRIPCRQV